MFDNGRTMANEPQKPERRRWRRLVVVFVLVFVSLCSWWYWPRGDARFVGRWEAFDAFPNESYWTLVFNANGTGRMEFPDGTTAGLMRWSVEGDQLRYGTPLPDGLLDAAAAVGDWLGQPIVQLQEHGKVIEVQADRIVFVRTGIAWDGDENADVTLRRIPE